jgi:sulfate adenylyltransferase subunit 2
MDHLDQLEQQSVYIFREAFRHFERLCMLWSIGKDSTVLLWLARKAFFGHVPFPLVHIDTSYKLPEMIQYRDRLAMEYKLHMVVGQNKEALAAHDTFPDKLKANPAMSREEQAEARTACCGRLKSDALKGTLHGTLPRHRLNLKTGHYELDPDKEAYTGVIVGARADEEGSRSKERYFSPRDKNNDWDVGDQPPEFWNQFKTDFAPGTHVRIHPLLDWTELHIWEYIKRENIPTVSLYYDQGSGTRYRSLGCGPCQAPIKSPSKNVDEIIVEIRSGALKNVAERSGRLQDGKHGLEELRRKGYM